MSVCNQILERFEQKSPFAVLIQSILQRLLPPNQLFEQAAAKQYQRTLLFSTLMTLMLEVVLKSSPSVHHSYLRHQDDIAVSIKSVWLGLELALPFEFWSRRIDGVDVCELSGYLKPLSGKINVTKFTKSRRGPKKKVTKKYDPKVNHVSTFKILNERKNNEK